MSHVLPVEHITYEAGPKTGSRRIPLAPERPLALAGNHVPLVRSVTEHLQNTVAQPILTCSLDDVRSLVGPETDGLLVLLAAAPADTEMVFTLVQELRLEK